MSHKSPTFPSLVPLTVALAKRLQKRCIGSCVKAHNWVAGLESNNKQKRMSSPSPRLKRDPEAHGKEQVGREWLFNHLTACRLFFRG